MTSCASLLFIHYFFSSAAEIAEDGNIIAYETYNASRICWKVPSAQGAHYMCLREFCPCRSFYELSKATRERVVCKHLLAILLAISFGSVNVQKVSDESFANFLCDDHS